MRRLVSLSSNSKSLAVGNECNIASRAHILFWFMFFRRSRQNSLSSNFFFTFLCTPSPLPLFFPFYLFILKAALHRRRRRLAGAFNNRLVFMFGPRRLGARTKKRRGAGEGPRAWKEKSIYGQSSHQPLISVWLHFKKKHSSALKKSSSKWRLASLIAAGR